MANQRTKKFVKQVAVVGVRSCPTSSALSQSERESRGNSFCSIFISFLSLYCSVYADRGRIPCSSLGAPFGVLVVVAEPATGRRHGWSWVICTRAPLLPGSATSNWLVLPWSREEADRVNSAAGKQHYYHICPIVTSTSILVACYSLRSSRSCCLHSPQRDDRNLQEREITKRKERTLPLHPKTTHLIQQTELEQESWGWTVSVGERRPCQPQPTLAVVHRPVRGLPTHT